jgi:putative flavoprotein involved in K+ transport
VPVFDRKGHLRHDGGVVDAAGVYALGLNFMRRRKSSFIHGAEDDVREVGAHLVAYLRRSPQGEAPSSPGISSAFGNPLRHVDSTNLKSKFH